MALFFLEGFHILVIYGPQRFPNTVHAIYVFEKLTSFYLLGELFLNLFQAILFSYHI